MFDTSMLLEELWGVAFFGLGNFGGGATGEDLTTSATTLGTHVDDPVSLTDDVEVVLDDDDRVTPINEATEYLHEDADVLKVEARSRLIEDVERLASIFL